MEGLAVVKAVVLAESAKKAETEPKDKPKGDTISKV